MIFDYLIIAGFLLLTIISVISQIIIGVIFSFPFLFFTSVLIIILIILNCKKK